MSCIIGTFTPEKIVVSADSAVSSENRTYTGVEKLIPLSNDPPILLAYYGNSDFCNIPLENIISEYIKKSDFKKINTVNDVKKDFLEFIKEIIPKNHFKKYITEELFEFKKEIRNLDKDGINYYSTISITQSNLIHLDTNDFNFEEMIPPYLSDREKNQFINNMKNIFISTILEKSNGIVIVGIDKKTMQNSYTSFEMIVNEKNTISLYNENEEIDIKGSKLKVFAQTDVIKSFLNGIDETILLEISQQINNYSNEMLDILLNNLQDKTEISKKDLNAINDEIDILKENSMIREEFNNTITNYQNENMKNILDEIEIMPREEIIKMSKTLINLTRLKRIISSEQVTVDGDILTYVLSLKNGIEKFL